VTDGAAAHTDELEEIRRRVLPRYEGWQEASVAPLGNGLINRTYLLTASGVQKRAVLQRVNPLFSPAIHHNILAVTERLAAAGLVTPRLIPTRDGRPWLELAPPAAAPTTGAAVWRMQTHVDGVAFDVVAEPEQARAAAGLIARFHRALDDLRHPFVGMRQGVHDTPRHLARLAEAVAGAPRHRLASEVGPLAAVIAAGAAALPPLPALPARVCHGDLKFNNILFAGPAGAASRQAVCLIDLDVVGPLSLSFELGDAWRSWCNRAGEDHPRAALDLEIFRASWAGYVEGLEGRPLGAPERQGLLLGVEWISLELAARFAADALLESYFGWDAIRFAGRGEHNLVRARGQWSLHQALIATRAARAAILAGAGD
jgi:Ser/Thr protein kinase RdoA (MazF antagonist)